MLAASPERQHRQTTQANHPKVTEWLHNVDVEGTLIFSDIFRPVKLAYICTALTRTETSKAIRYGTRYRGITQFYLHTPCFIRNRNEPYLPLLPSQNWYTFTDPEGMEC